MRKTLRYLLFPLLIFPAAVWAQTGNTFYAKNFAGPDVATKVTNAQDACQANASLPCVIVLDPALAQFSQGVLPARCSNCVWVDYRSPGYMRVSPYTAKVPGMVADGDSLTQGLEGVINTGAYPADLQAALFQPVENTGVGGQTGPQIAVRQGAIQTYITAQVSATAGSATAVTWETGYEPVTSQGPTGGTQGCFLSGTPTAPCGVATYSSGTWYFTPNGTAIVYTIPANAKFQVTNPYANYLQLIDSGRNDIFSTGCATVQMTVAAMAANSPNGYLIGAILNGNLSAEWKGGANYATLTACNTALANSYQASGGWVVDSTGNDLREHLVTLGCFSSNITDLSDCTHDEIPTEFRAVMATGTLNAAIGATDTTIYVNVASGSLSSESNEILTIDTGANMENVQVVSVSGSSNPYTVTVVRNYGGNNTSHSSGATANGSSNIHLNATGYAAEAAAWKAMLSQPGSGAIITAQDLAYLMAKVGQTNFAGFNFQNAAGTTLLTMQAQGNGGVALSGLTYLYGCSISNTCMTSLGDGTYSGWNNIWLNGIVNAGGVNTWSNGYNGTEGYQLSYIGGFFKGSSHLTVDGSGNFTTGGATLVLGENSTGNGSIGNVSYPLADVQSQNFRLVPTGGGNYIQFNPATLSSTTTITVPNVTATMQLSLSGTTGSIGGSALANGACATGTVSVTGAAVGQAVCAGPNTFPGAGFNWEAYVSASGTVTVEVCNATGASNTPTASTYNVQVLE